VESYAKRVRVTDLRNVIDADRHSNPLVTGVEGSACFSL
jgi:hypothetical protein